MCIRSLQASLLDIRMLQSQTSDLASNVIWEGWQGCGMGAAGQCKLENDAVNRCMYHMCHGATLFLGKL